MTSSMFNMLFGGAILLTAGQGLAQTPKETPAKDEKSASDVTVTYIANMGVLIKSGDKSVIIDGLFRHGNPTYDNMTPEQLDIVEGGQAPFDGAEVIMATHEHTDHFDAQSVSRYMQTVPGAHFLANREVMDELSRTPGFESYRDRARSITGPVGSMELFENNGVEVEIHPLSHGGGPYANIINLGFVVHIGGKRILHVGDAYLDDATIRSLKSIDGGYDAICISYVWLEDPKGEELIAKTLKPKHLVVLHFPDVEVAMVVPYLRRHYPDASFLTDFGQTAKLSPSK